MLTAATTKRDGTNMAAAVVRRRRTTLGAVLRSAVRRGLIETNPLDQVEWRAPERDIAVDVGTVPSVADVVRSWTMSLALGRRPATPPSMRSLGRTIVRWAAQTVAWHAWGLTNAATEAANNLIKRVKRVGFGFRSFRNYRNKPTWAGCSGNVAGQHAAQ